jgi:predicted RNA-binding Zn ribbon-like protein
MLDEPVALALDFANTAGWHAGPSPEERLTTYRAAVDWAAGAGILSREQVELLIASAQDQPARAQAALERIIALREAVYRIFAALAHDLHPAEGDLEILHLELRQGLPHLRLALSAPETADSREAANAHRFVWAWTDLESDLAGFLWPVAAAAATLLTSPQLARVRICADDDCGWLFIDHSKNASRRWCDMGDCGNRAKARRYRARQRSSAP